MGVVGHPAVLGPLLPPAVGCTAPRSAESNTSRSLRSGTTHACPTHYTSKAWNLPTPTRDHHPARTEESNPAKVGINPLHLWPAASAVRPTSAILGHTQPQTSTSRSQTRSVKLVPGPRAACTILTHADAPCLPFRLRSHLMLRNPAERQAPGSLLQQALPWPRRGAQARNGDVAPRSGSPQDLLLNARRGYLECACAACSLKRPAGRGQPYVRFRSSIRPNVSRTEGGIWTRFKFSWQRLWR